jgi:hypothetical protein
MKLKRLFGAQALFHELFAFIAGEGLGFGIGVASLHFVLLGGASVSGRTRRLGAKAVLHEGFALIACQRLGFGIGVAGLHLVLLRGRSLLFGSMGTAHCQCQAQSYQGDQLFHQSSYPKDGSFAAVEEKTLTNASI